MDSDILESMIVDALSVSCQDKPPIDIVAVVRQYGVEKLAALFEMPAERMAAHLATDNFFLVFFS